MIYLEDFAIIKAQQAVYKKMLLDAKQERQISHTTLFHSQKHEKRVDDLNFSQIWI